MSIDHRVQPKRRRLLALSLALASGALVTGCSSATGAIEDTASSGPQVEDDPEEVLRDAVAATGEWEGIQATLRFEVDDDARSRVGSDLSAEEVEMLLGWSIVVRATGLDDPEETGFETSVTIDDAPVLDLRVSSDDRVFLRLDFEALSTLSDETDLGDLDELVVAARMLGLGDVAEAAAEGRWIELLGVEQLGDLADPGRAGEPQVDDEQRGALDARIATTLEQFVDEDVEVSYIGSEDIGERVRLTTDGASLESLLDDLTTELDRAGLLEDAGVRDLDGLDIEADTVVTMDAWIDDGELRQLALDLDTLDEDDELPGAVLVISLDEFTGSITEPDDAEPFDLLSLDASLFDGDTGAEKFGDFDDDPVGDEDGAPACITQDELDLIEEFEGEDELEELEQLFDAGVLQRC